MLLVTIWNFPPKHFPLSFTRVRFLLGTAYFLADVMCRFRNRRRMFAFGWLVVAWEWLERMLAALGLSFDSGIL